MALLVRCDNCGKTADMGGDIKEWFVSKTFHGDRLVGAQVRCDECNDAVAAATSAALQARRASPERAGE